MKKTGNGTLYAFHKFYILVKRGPDTRDWLFVEAEQEQPVQLLTIAHRPAELGLN